MHSVSPREVTIPAGELWLDRYVSSASPGLQGGELHPEASPGFLRRFPGGPNGRSGVGSVIKIERFSLAS